MVDFLWTVTMQRIDETLRSWTTKRSFECTYSLEVFLDFFIKEVQIGIYNNIKLNLQYNKVDRTHQLCRVDFATLKDNWTSSVRACHRIRASGTQTTTQSKCLQSVMGNFSMIIKAMVTYISYRPCIYICASTRISLSST